MSKKKDIERNAKKLEEYYSKFPDWYWKYGLHDTLILSVSEQELTPDWKSKNPRRNCLEICLDSSNAIYERDICKICLYNYVTKTPQLNFNNLEKSYWIQDTLTKLPHDYYLLEINILTARGKDVLFAVEFEIPEIERKQ